MYLFDMNELFNSDTRGFHSQTQSTRGKIKHAGNVRKIKQHQSYRKQMKLERKKR